MKPKAVIPHPKPTIKEAESTNQEERLTRLEDHVEKIVEAMKQLNEDVCSLIQRKIEFRIISININSLISKDK